MSWFSSRLVIGAVASAAAVIGAGLAARGAARDAVERARDETIDAAALEARRRIADEARVIAAALVRRFAVSTSVKAAAAALLWIAYAASVITGPLFSALLGALLFILGARDVVRSAPTLRMLLDALRAHRWRPKTALAEVVAAEVMAEALRRADARETDWRERLALAVAGVDRSDLARQVAEAVSDIARRATWRDIRPIIAAAAVKIGLGAALYSLFVGLILAAASG